MKIVGFRIIYQLAAREQAEDLIDRYGKDIRAFCEVRGLIKNYSTVKPHTVGKRRYAFVDTMIAK